MLAPLPSTGVHEASLLENPSSHTSHPTLHTPHSTPHTPHPTPHTPHPTPHIMETQLTYFEEQRLEIEQERNELLREQNELLKQQNTLFARMGATVGKLNTIAEFLSLAIINKTVCRFTYPLKSFATFDWDEFGATINKTDRSGAAVVVWRGETYTRRSYAKNGNDVWYSRLIGTTEGGKHIYDILIRFSENHGKATSLPDEVKEAAGITA